MDYIENKYKLPITRSLLGNYMELTINGIFKLLPTYEGKSFQSKEIVYSPEQAYMHYQQHLEKVIVEVVGDYYIYDNNEEYLKLLAILEGLKEVYIDEHDKVKSMVFECIKICERIQEKLNKDIRGENLDEGEKI